MRDRPLLWVLVMACLLAPVFRYVSFVTADLAEWASYAPYALPHCRMDNLAVGGIAALVVRGGSPGLRTVIGRAALPLWIVAGVVHALWDRTDTAFVISGYSMVGAATAATIVLLLDRRSPRLAAVLRNRPLVYIGKISYGLYLLHLFVRAGSSMGPVGPISASFAENAALALVRTAVLIAVAVAVAGLSFHFFERPILRLKDRLAPRVAKERARDYLAEDEPRAGMPA
jgi:peptidoglycan/LPS O-acetylase OafA/YrhL